MKRILEGLKILIKYFPSGDFSAEHDQVWAGDDIDDLGGEGISKEDKKELEKLGWFIDSEHNCWCHFC